MITNPPISVRNFIDPLTSQPLSYELRIQPSLHPLGGRKHLLLVCGFQKSPNFVPQSSRP